MNLRRFLAIFKNNLENVLFKENIVFGKYDGDVGYSEWTLMMNVIIYNTVKKYNKIYKEKLKISPEYGGKSPSDFCILNNKKEIELYIEHENSPDRLWYNLRKIFSSKIKAKERLLICYERPKDIEKTISKLKKQKPRFKVYVWIAPWNIQRMSEYKNIIIKSYIKNDK